MSCILPALFRSIPTVDSRLRRQTLMLYLALVWNRPRTNGREDFYANKKRKKGLMRNRRDQSIPYRSNGLLLIGIQQHGIEYFRTRLGFGLSISVVMIIYPVLARPRRKALVRLPWWRLGCMIAYAAVRIGARGLIIGRAPRRLFFSLSLTANAVLLSSFIFMFGFFTLILHLYRVAEYA